jgi:hypothetical protein
MRPDSHLSGTAHDAKGKASALATFPLPCPGQKVCWRDRQHALAIGWLAAYGPGPFEVVRVVDKSHLDIPPAVVVRTNLGEREINLVWLVGEP